MKAIELYKADNGSYPPTSATSAAGEGTTGCSANGYSYSWGQDANWMKPLVDGGYLKKVPIPPTNDCSHYYRYLKGTATSYGCTTRTTGWYMLQVVGAEGASTPNDAAYFSPCVGATANWGTSSTTWTFAKDDI